MSMTMTVHIENATPEEIAKLFGNYARLAEAALQQGTTAPKAVEQPKEEPAVEIAKKNMYMYHAESDAYFMVKKGDELPQHDIDFCHCVELTKAEWDKGKKAAEAKAAPAKEPATPKAEEPADEPKQAHTFDELRDLLTAKARDGKEIKPFLNSLGFERLSAVAADRIDEVYAKAEAL